jgi:hypothetical protein
MSMSSDNNGYCGKCGAQLQAGVSYCTTCGAAVSSSTPPSVRTATSVPSSQQLDWREQRRQMRAQRRAERGRSGIGALVVATILIVAGIGIFFPQLPWQVFWASLLIILGLWIVYLWVRRSGSYPSTQSAQKPQ